MVRGYNRHPLVGNFIW